MKRILIIDDDPDILALVEMVFTMEGFVVKAILRWEEIDESIKDFKPGILLMDVSLKGADGRDICKAIKHTDNTAHLPVVLFSANSQMSEFVEDCQAQAFVPKPFELSFLLGTVMNVLEKQG